MTVAISASLVKELRDQTGAGMMDAKQALVDASGDIEAARILLRERGMASAAKRSGRETTEGIVLLKTGDDRGSLVAIGCETEPVSKNEEFRSFAQRVLEGAYSTYLAEKVDDLEQKRNELIAKIGENIAIVGTVTFEAVDGGVIEGYVHYNGKVGALVQLRGGDAELARRIAMHIAWFDPRWVSRDDAPSDLVATERDIYLNSDEVQSKPEQAREKIVNGMMNKRFFAERGGALLDQPWLHESSQTVAQALGNAEVLEFERLALAG